MLGRARGTILLVVSIAGIVLAGNTTCKNTSLDWFTESVGETPCRVYERLRQACSAEYQVGNMNSAPPGDTCSGQPATCCCNSVAFALSMLCMNCQYGFGTSVGGDHGFDAGAGAYGLYLNGCGTSTNTSLPSTVQAAVCTQGIKIPSYLYSLFWAKGDWFYEYTKGTAQLSIQSGKNDSGLCTTTSTSVTSSTALSSSTPSSSAGADSNAKSTNVGAIAGGVIGGAAILVLAALAGFIFSRRHKRRGIVDLTEDSHGQDMSFEPYIPPAAPAQPVATVPVTGAPSSSGRTSIYAMPSASAMSPSASPSPAPLPRSHKPGLIATSPPTRAEISQAQPLLSSGPGTSTESIERHEDSEELTSVFGLGRSPSGRLPPSYQDRN